MVAQANTTGTSKNMTNKKNNVGFTLHINYVALNSQYPLQILNHDDGDSPTHPRPVKSDTM